MFIESPRKKFQINFIEWYMSEGEICFLRLRKMYANFFKCYFFSLSKLDEILQSSTLKNCDISTIYSINYITRYVLWQITFENRFWSPLKNLYFSYNIPGCTKWVSQIDIKFFIGWHDRMWRIEWINFFLLLVHNFFIFFSIDKKSTIK